MKSISRSRLFRGFSVALLGLGTAYAAFRGWVWEGYTDFDVYYIAGERFLNYWLEGPQGFKVPEGELSPYRYAPVFGWLFVPISLLPHQVARVLWMAAQWLIYGDALFRLKRHFSLSEGKFLLLILGTIRFAVDNSNIGQVSAIIAWLLVIAATRPHLTGGVALGVAGLVKLQPVPLALIAVSRRQWTKVSWFIASLFVLVSLSYVSFGSRAFHIWIDLLTRADTLISPAIAGNQSLYGVFLRTAGAYAVPAFFFAFFAATAASLRIWYRSRWSESVAWALGLGLLPVFGILTWKNSYLVMLYPLALFLHHRPVGAAALAFAFLVPSQGLLGDRLNLLCLEYGLLPWSVLIGVLVLSRGAASGDALVHSSQVRTTLPRLARLWR